MKKRIFFLSVLIFSIIASAFYFNIDISNSYARDGKNRLKASSYEYNDIDKTLTVSQNFTMLEIAENNGTMTNISSIDINLGTSRWNVTNIEFDITDINFKNETKIIEDTPKNARLLNKQNKGYAVQINIPALTKIYGLFIYGEQIQQVTAPVFIQINDVDILTNKPNRTVHRAIALNISTETKWHYQNFETPVDLPKGNYSLILNGTEMLPSDNGKINWYYNYGDIKYPNLYSWDYVLGPWGDGETGFPFLYKIKQRVLQDFYPQKIDMRAEINGTDHPIINGIDIGTGNLSLAYDGYFPNTKNWNIPVKNNISKALIFNLSYYIKLNNSLSIISSVLIRESLNNSWTIEPKLKRFGKNYTVKFNYSNHWSNLEVYKNGIKLTSTGNYSDDGDILEIFNNTITDPLIIWKITANSSNFGIDLYVPETDFSAGDKLSFRVNFPAKLGNYSFVLIDTVGAKEHEELKEVASPAQFYFNYTLPSILTPGEWTAFVFWNNETDAGIQTQLFQITGGGGGGGGTTILPPSGDDDDDSKTTTE
ncbi:MAG: hypothetical protein EU535_07225, partial [Promethearchaeota archaeon]